MELGSPVGNTDSVFVAGCVPLMPRYQLKKRCQFLFSGKFDKHENLDYEIVFLLESDIFLLEFFSNSIELVMMTRRGRVVVFGGLKGRQH